MAEILILRLLALVGIMAAAYWVYKVWKRATSPEREEKEEIRQIKQIIETSKAWNGRVIAADIALSLEIPMHEADQLLAKLVSEGLATAEVAEDATLVYDIPRAKAKDTVTLGVRRLGGVREKE